MENVQKTLAAFAAATRFDDLPADVVHEIKRGLLDSIGCALAARSIEKGRLSIALSQRLGGPAEASIIGAKGLVSANHAALANGELINALDYDALFIPGGHVAPYVIPAILAVAEMERKSGRDLVLALAIGTEVAMRVTRGMSPMVQNVVEGPDRLSYRWTDPYGGSRYNVGAAAGVARLLGLDEGRTGHALGLAGHHTQVPTHAKLSYSIPTAMTKYGTPGWQSTGAIIAGLLAQMGCVGDETLFDGPSGFWRFTGSEKWEPEKVVSGLGEEWCVLEQQYKPYPCCRVVHTSLDLFYGMMQRYGWTADRIEGLRVFGSAYCEKPHLQNKVIKSPVDAQFSVAYNFACAAHGVPIGVEWQDEATMSSSSILAFMEKVTCEVHPEYKRRPLKDRLMILGRVEVTVDGKVYTEEAEFARGTPRPGYQLSDAELVDKFKHNASRVLDQGQIHRAVDALLALESLTDLGKPMQEVKA